MVSTPKVLVGGLGYAGLSTLYHLVQGGLDEVIGFDPRPEPGGRASTNVNMLAGAVIDEGPEFVGENHDTMLRLARHFNVGLRRMRDYEGPFSPIIPGSGRTAATCSAVDAEMAALGLRLVEDARNIDLQAPWESPNALTLDHQSLGDWLSCQKVSDLCRRAFDIQVVANHGVPLDKLSLLAFLLLVKAHGLERYLTETEVYRFEGGAQAVAIQMAKSLGKRVRFGEGVMSVEFDGREALVTLRSGERIRTPHFVNTIPPSVWNRVQFKPALPKSHIVQMGMSVKVFVVLRGRERFQAGLAPLAITEGGLLQLIWDATEGQEHDSMVLTCFSGGSAAVKLSSMDEAALRDLVLSELSEIVLDLSERLESIGIRRWPREEHIHAGYSAPGLGQITEVMPLLAQGIGPMLFAGEHCAEHWAFMDGAAASGAAVAGWLLRAHGLGRPEEIEVLLGRHFRLPVCSCC